MTGGNPYPSGWGGSQAAVLIQLRKASASALREAITDGWLACAPAKLADQYLHR